MATKRATGMKQLQCPVIRLVPWVAPAVGSYDGRPAGLHDILVIAILRFSVFLWEKCHARRFFI